MKKSIFLIMLMLLVMSIEAFSCPEKQQQFDNNCYPCDSSTSYLQFNSNDRSISCVSCNNGFEIQNGHCVQKPVIVHKNAIGARIDFLAEKISNFLGSENTLVGFIIIFIIVAYGLYLFLKRFK